MARFHILRDNIANSGRVEGDVSSVYADGVGWGASGDMLTWLVDHPWMYVLSIPGMPLEVAERFTQRWYRPAVPGDPEYNAPDLNDRMVYLGPHRWQLGVNDKLPGPVKNQLRQDGYLIIEPYDQATINTLNSYVNDRNELDVWITDNPIDPQPPDY